MGEQFSVRHDFRIGPQPILATFVGGVRIALTFFPHCKGEDRAGSIARRGFGELIERARTASVEEGVA